MTMKTCSMCGQTMEATHANWAWFHGKPHGGKCRVCKRAAVAKCRAKIRATPEGRAKHNTTCSAYHRLHRARNLLSTAKSKQHYLKQHPSTRAWYAALLRQTPPWITAEMLDQMDALYATRKLGESVDHRVPLVGKDTEGNHIVSGLNVPWNLQVIPQSVNSRKGNWFHQV